MPASVEDYVLLYPEDANGWATEPAYGIISSTTRRGMEVRGLGHCEGRTALISEERASQRAVPPREATGPRPGLWVRKAVCYGIRGFYYFGQVTGYSGSRLFVSTCLGVRTVNCSHVAGEVYPVVAIALGARRWFRRVWPFERLEDHQDRLIDRLLAGEGGCLLSAVDWPSEVHDEVGDLSRREVSWISPATGLEHLTSLAMPCATFTTRRARTPFRNPSNQRSDHPSARSRGTARPSYHRPEAVGRASSDPWAKGRLALPSLPQLPCCRAAALESQVTSPPQRAGWTHAMPHLQHQDADRSGLWLERPWRTPGRVATSAATAAVKTTATTQTPLTLSWT